MSPTATTSRSFPMRPCSEMARKTNRPKRPKPLIATFTGIEFQGTISISNVRCYDGACNRQRLFGPGSNVQGDVLYFFPVPRIGDMDLAIIGLNDRRIRKFAPLGFQR